jgi:hypothetical protein
MNTEWINTEFSYAELEDANIDFTLIDETKDEINKGSGVLCIRENPEGQQKIEIHVDQKISEHKLEQIVFGINQGLADLLVKDGDRFSLHMPEN